MSTEKTRQSIDLFQVIRPTDNTHIAAFSNKHGGKGDGRGNGQKKGKKQYIKAEKLRFLLCFCGGVGLEIFQYREKNCFFCFFFLDFSNFFSQKNSRNFRSIYKICVIEEVLV